MHLARTVRTIVRTRTVSHALFVSLSVAGLSASQVDASQLEHRIEDQEARIRSLERRFESGAQPAQSTSAGRAATGGKGFSITSADGGHQLKLRGLLHFDGRHHLDDVAPDTADTWLLRRVRPTIEGVLYDTFDFRLTPDFAGGRAIILDAYGAVRLRPWATLTVGKFKVPVGLERLVSADDMRFIERGFPTSLVPNRDLGLQLAGEALGQRLQYSLGVYNGVVDGSSSDAQGDTEIDGARDYAARLFVQPFRTSERFALRGLGFGVAATYSDVDGAPQTPSLSSLRNPDQQTFFRWRGDDSATSAINEATFLNGRRVRLTPQAYYYAGPFGVLGEYVSVRQEVSRATANGIRNADLENTAWQVQLSYFLTGEQAQFKGFTPGSTFRPNGESWGAFELVARYQELEIDAQAFAGGAASFADPATQPRKAAAYTVGLNWRLNENVKWQINYEHVSYRGGAADGADRDDSKAILTRFAIGF